MLQNALLHPNAAYMAGGAAAVAGALTLLDPHAAQATAEKQGVGDRPIAPPRNVSSTVPEEVFDRLDGVGGD